MPHKRISLKHYSSLDSAPRTRKSLFQDLGIPAGLSNFDLNGKLSIELLFSGNEIMIQLLVHTFDVPIISFRSLASPDTSFLSERKSALNIALSGNMHLTYFRCRIAHCLYRSSESSDFLSWVSSTVYNLLLSQEAVLIRFPMHRVSDAVHSSTLAKSIASVGCQYLEPFYLGKLKGIRRDDHPDQPDISPCAINANHDLLDCAAQIRSIRENVLFNLSFL